MTTTTTKDTEFFFELIVFQVDDVIFRVPKHHFLHDVGIFSTTLSLPTPLGTDGKPQQPIEGASEEKPIILEGVSLKDFKAFLRFLYPPVLSVTRDLTEDEWLSVLHLSTLWQASSIRELAIRQLHGLWDKQANYTTRIIQGYKHDIQDWIIEGFYLLAKRHRGLTIQEAVALGAEATRIVYEIRELTFKDRQSFPDYKRLVEGVLRMNGVHPTLSTLER